MFQGRTPPHSGSSSNQQARTKAKAVAPLPPPPVRLLVPAGDLSGPQQTFGLPKAACAAPRLVLPKAACAAPPVVRLLGPAAGVPSPRTPQELLMSIPSPHTPQELLTGLMSIPSPHTPPEMRVPCPRTPVEIFVALGCSSKAAAAAPGSTYGASMPEDQNVLSLSTRQILQHHQQQQQQQQLPIVDGFLHVTELTPTSVQPVTLSMTMIGSAAQPFTPPMTETGIAQPFTPPMTGIAMMTGSAAQPFTPPMAGIAQPFTPMSFQPVTPPMTGDAVPFTPSMTSGAPFTPPMTTGSAQPFTPTSGAQPMTAQPFTPTTEQHLEWPLTPSIMSPTRCGRAASLSASS